VYQTRAWHFGRAVFVLAALLLSLSGCGSKPRVVLYSAQDEDFAEEVLYLFKSRTGIEVSPKYDTEKDKSVSLYLELVKEKDRPRCDVFWNNEILMTLLLQRQGLLEAYESPSAAPYPEWAKASDHTWHAFAARARVLVVNTNVLSEGERPKSLLVLTEPRWKGRVVMAKPSFGTSSTQAACLFDVLGPDRAKEFYRGLKANGVHVAPGNKQVAEWVAQGHTPLGQPVAVGVTDTDDALGMIEVGAPVAMIFPDRDRPKDDRMGTLFIPNTLSIIKGGPNRTAARKLVDFLLSGEMEGRLAESGGRQIPLNPEVTASLPPGMATPATAKPMNVDWARAADCWKESQEFLRQEFTGD
jgi:iron(III) transport system substrate-binding protein